MERPQDTIEESAESVNPKDQGPSIPDPFEVARGEDDVPVVSTEALIKISQDMARVFVKPLPLTAVGEGCHTEHRSFNLIFWHY